MKIEVIVEKSTDGLFAAYSETAIGNFTPAGYGHSVEEALKDFEVSIDDMNAIRIEEGLSPIQGIELEKRYDIESFFNKFDFLNISKLAERAGINPSLMRQYASGLTKAGQKQYDKIRIAIANIAYDLSKVQL